MGEAVGLVVKGVEHFLQTFVTPQTTGVSESEHGLSALLLQVENEGRPQAALVQKSLQTVTSSVFHDAKF